MREEKDPIAPNSMKIGPVIVQGHVEFYPGQAIYLYSSPDQSRNGLSNIQLGISEELNGWTVTKLGIAQNYIKLCIDDSGSLSVL